MSGSWCETCRRSAKLVIACLLLPTAVIAGELPQPLSLGDALEHISPDLAAEKIASEYQETAIRERVFDCRAQDRFSTAGEGDRGCGFWHLLLPVQQTRLDVLRRFLDVVEADLATSVDDEAMAVAYVQLDRARNREELGQYSPLAVSELEVEYQRVRGHRFLAQARQRATRARLSMAMGWSGALPSEVQAFEFPALPKQLDELDKMTEEALAGNPVLIDWKQRAELNPAINPLLKQLEIHLKDAILDLWLRYPVILAERDMDDARDFYQELKLDRSRTLYELEAQADLGDAMTEQTAARFAGTETDHRAWVLLATLSALRGKPYDFLSKQGESTP